MGKTNETVYVMDSAYMKQLQEFGDHMIETKDELMNILEVNGEYDSRFDLNISCNGKQARIELHADAYDRIMTMIENEISEFCAMNGMDMDNPLLDAIEEAEESHDFETASRLTRELLGGEL